jgi:iron complex outermembrane recepter protein
VKVTGLDFAVSYVRETSFGSWDAAANANYQLKRDNQVSPISPTVDQLEFDRPLLLAQATLGTNIGDLRAQATWNHTDGYDVVRSATLPQNQVSAFDTINLFFKYALTGERLMKDLSFTLNVNNVLDEEPPLFRSSGGGGYDSSGGTFTLGREFIFGVQKTF